MTIEALLKKTDLYTDDIIYSIVKLPPVAITVAAGILAEIGEAFSALIVDKDEVTLVIPADAIADFSTRLRDYIPSPKNYRLITLDIVLDFSVIGFMAHISRALAEANISILPFAAFSRDHLLVSVDDFDNAWRVLMALKS